jgi:hypothetical protein
MEAGHLVSHSSLSLCVIMWHTLDDSCLSSMVVSLLSNSELPLVEFGDQLPHTLLEVCSAHKEKVEIKCIGSVGGKHQ